MMRHTFYSIFLLITFSQIGYAQGDSNPFDLPDRGTQEEQVVEEQAIRNENPFDLVSTPRVTNNPLDLVTPEVSSSSTQSKLNDTPQAVKIGISMLLLIPLALLLTLFRGVFNDFLESAYRDRKFNQFFRRMKSMWVVPNILLYIFFFLSISVFIHLALMHYGYNVFESIVQSISFISLSIAGFFVVKHAVIRFLGDTFDVKNESSRYGLLILTFNIILGVFITPINLLLLLGPETMRGNVVVIGLIICALLIALLLLRAISVSNRLLTQHSFHFFMYLCTIEIAPLIHHCKTVDLRG